MALDRVDTTKPVRYMLGYGLGVDSTAVLLRWIYEPQTRPCPLSELVVITAMTGDGRLPGPHRIPGGGGRVSEEFLDRLLAVLDELPLLEHTRPEEWGPCALCLPGARKRSVSSLTIEAGPLVSPARLLQLCARCDASVRHMASDWPGDEAVLRRYRQLQAAGRISRRGRRRSGPASE